MALSVAAWAPPPARTKPGTGSRANPCLARPSSWAPRPGRWWSRSRAGRCCSNARGPSRASAARGPRPPPPPAPRCSQTSTAPTPTGVRGPSGRPPRRPGGRGERWRGRADGPPPRGLGPGGAAPAFEDAHRGGRPDGVMEPWTYDLRGNFEPEAFSTDDRRLFLIQHLPAEAPPSTASPCSTCGPAGWCRCSGRSRPGRADAGDPAAAGALADRRPAVHAVLERAARVRAAPRPRAERRDGVVRPTC